MAERPGSSRRGFLRILGRVGVGVVGAAAGLTATQRPAAADGYCNRRPGCCCLKSRTDCSGAGSPNYTCPSGWTKRSWTCCSGGTTYGCGECQVAGDSCWNGWHYICSTSWTAGSC